MDQFSLEDDEYNSIFITQTPKAQKVDEYNVGILPNGNDFGSPLVGLVSGSVAQYSDISEDEFEIPSSQLNGTKLMDNQRYL